MVTIADNNGKRELKTDSNGFVHWQYKPNDQGTHSLRLEAAKVLNLPADPIQTTFQVEKCSWELMLIYAEVGGVDLE